MVHNEKGFTLLSVLAGFMILLLLIPLFTFALKYWIQSKPDINEFTNHEYYIFLTQLEMEFQESESYHISHNNRALSFTNGSDIIRYEPYQTSIRRVVNGAGHEVTLQHAGTYGYELHPAGIKVWREDRGRRVSRLLLHPQYLAERKNLPGQKESLYEKE